MFVLYVYVYLNFSLTIFVHVGVEALVEAACATLVAVRLVDRTLSSCVALRLARVRTTLVNAALEKARASC